ncbi:P-loop containing nucleoside triphosphate hydrolase protein [Xylaria venustula]|nr:P-loop containing nucleoside triphosphate hydrolase protein [Xylaria venustula]
METQNRLSALLRAAQMPISNSFLRTLLDMIRSLIASIYDSSLSIAHTSYITPTQKLRQLSTPLIICILGSPGAGKGTQSALLKRAIPGFTHLSYGDLIRYEDRIPGSWVSSLPRRHNTKTPVVPADGAMQLIRQTIDSGAKHGQLMWLVDGFPRRESHVKAWAAQMPPAQCTLYFSCPRDLAIQRVIGRAEASGRPDDADPRLVTERIDRSISERDALLFALHNYGIRAVEIDAAQSVDDVKRIVHTVCQEAIKPWKLEQGL